MARPSADRRGRRRACTSTGTSDRVLLLSGSLHSVLTAIFLILEKVARDAAAGKNKQPGGKDSSEREDEVRAALLDRAGGREQGGPQPTCT